ncbi:MAG: hypothetical protein H7A25_07845 [Leptospiraceae bacterium]|nr:hypothetical protein [Leptospiraceae bacterium]MCP5499797.1 hypothetical protein [Leptospiraceae bacterium]
MDKTVSFFDSVYLVSISLYSFIQRKADSISILVDVWECLYQKGVLQ